MTVKSIIDIEVRDDRFKAFAATFDKYQAALGKTPKAWKAVTGSVEDTKKVFDTMVSQQVAQIGRAKLLAEAEKQATQLTRTRADAWKDIAKHTKNAAVNMANMTLQFTKWVAIGGIASGLLTGGGLFGLTSLAEAVSSRRYNSVGLGTTYGAGSAFQNSFSRVVNPDQFLGNISQAKGDVTKRGGLYGLGITDGEFSKDTAELGITVLRKLKLLADNTDEKYYGNTLKGRGLDGFASTEDLRRLHGMSKGDFEKMVTDYRGNTGPLGLDKKTQDSWTNFTVQMDAASKLIETSLMRALSGLAEPLTHLSKSFVKLFDALGTSDTVKNFIDYMAKGIETFAKYIGTEEFRNNVKDFVDSISTMAGKIRDLLQYLGLVPAAEAHNDASGSIVGDGGGRVARHNLRYGYRSRGGTSGVDRLDDDAQQSVLDRYMNGSNAGMAQSSGLTLPDYSMTSGDMKPTPSGFFSKFGATDGYGDYARGFTAEQGHVFPGAFSRLGGLQVGSDTSGVPKNLTELIHQAAYEVGGSRGASIEAVMEGIRAGESGHGSKYDSNTQGRDNSWGWAQLNLMGGGLGAQYERETGHNVKDPRYLPAYTRWVAKYINEHNGPNGQWMGFHGTAHADPRWGDAGYDPKITIDNHIGSGVNISANQQAQQQ